MAALYGTIAAFSIATLVSQSKMFQDGRWLPYTIGVLLFAFLADRGARAEQPPIRLAVIVLGLEATVLIVLAILSDYFS